MMGPRDRRGSGPGHRAGSPARCVGVVLIGLAMLVGCRIDGPQPDPTPPVLAGDTEHIDSTEAAVADPSTPTPIVRSRGLVLPVAGVRPEDLVDTFEDARSEGRVHNAIDILAPRGAAVLAAVDGEVVRLFESEKGGRTIYQLDADTARTRVYYYAHLDAYADGLAAGDTVRAGEVIGTVGDSGNAEPGNTHLHFAIWDAPSRNAFWDGAPVNPYDLLATPD